jgi:hypothetical protein
MTRGLTGAGVTAATGFGLAEEAHAVKSTIAMGSARRRCKFVRILGKMKLM